MNEDYVQDGQNSHGSNEPFRFNSKQLEVYRYLLRLVGNGPASLYKDACIFMQEKDRYDNTVHFVAHALREIESALRRVCKSTVEFEEPERCEMCGSKPSTHQREIIAILESLGFEEDDPTYIFWLKLSKHSESDFHLGRLAHREALGNSRRIDDKFLKLWEGIEIFVSDVLEKMEGRYEEYLSKLDEFTQQETPTNRQLTMLQNDIPVNDVTQSYFYTKLHQPNWLQRLYDKGFFSSPPVNDQKWHILSFLKEMAKSEGMEQLVLEISISIPETSNYLVEEDLIEVAQHLSPRNAAKLVEARLSNWANLVSYFTLAFDLSRLASHLAIGNEEEAALAVLSDLYAFSADEKEEQYSREVEVTPVQNVGHYTSLLEENASDIVREIGIDGLSLFTDLLSKSIPRKSHCHIWYSRIEGNSVTHRDEVRTALATTVRDGALKLIDDGVSIDKVITCLKKNGDTMSLRLAYYIAEKYPEHHALTIPLLVVDGDMWREYDYFDELWFEYLEYIKSVSERISPDLIKELMIIIDKGPDIESFITSQKRYDKEPDQELIDSYISYWKRDRLHAIEPLLGTSAKTELDELREGLGTPKKQEFSAFARTVIDESPKSREELESMTLDSLVEYLKNWQPSGGFHDPNPSGLGNMIESMAKDNFEDFSKNAVRFIGLDPTYVRSLLRGIHESVKLKNNIHWPAIIELSSWVISQDAEIPDRQVSHFEADKDWRWARSVILNLIVSGMDQNLVPFDLQDQIWSIIEKLSQDTDPDEKYESKYGGENSNPYELAANSIRSEAIQAAIIYCSWVLRSKGIEPNAEGHIEQGFQYTPEVAQLLEKHLNPDHESSLAVRSVFGYRMPTFQYLDSDWFRRNINNILPLEENNRALFDSAWLTYLLYGGGPYNKTFETLMDYYTTALEQLGRSYIYKQGNWKDAEERLVGHIILMYQRGIIELDHPLIQSLFSSDKYEMKAEAIELVGRITLSDNGDVPEKWTNRAIALWNWRITEIESSASADLHSAELAAFGWWFECSSFSTDWAIRQLETVLKLSRCIDRDFLVVRKLSEICSDYPMESLRCAKYIIKGENRAGWGISGYKKELKKLLENLIALNSEDVSKEVREVIGLLCSMGFEPDFRSLLDLIGN